MVQHDDERLCLFILRPMADFKEFRQAGTPLKGPCKGRTFWLQVEWLA